MDDTSLDAPYDDAPTRNIDRETTAGDVVRLATLWVAAGALFKLFAGSPNDLPPQVLEHFGRFVEAPVAFRLIISAELFIVLLGLFRPKLAWLPLILLFGVFDFYLWPLVQAGDSSCGCFGSSVTIPPYVMMGIDTALLVAILVTRPWSTLAKQPFRPLVLLPLIAVAGWAPWHVFKTGSSAVPATTASSATPSEPEATPDETETPVDPEATGGGGDEVAQPDPNEPSEAPIPVGWALPDPLPDYQWFEAKDWEGKEVHELDLYTFLDVDLLPLDCDVVFYRQQCDHCAEHLQKLATEPGPMPLVLVRVPEDSDTPENDVTTVKPIEHMPMELPQLARGYGLNTPVSMRVEGWTVSQVEDRDDLSTE